MLLFQSVHQRLVASVVLAFLRLQAEFVLVVSEHLDESFHDQLGYLRLEAGNSDHLDELVEVLRIHLTRLDHIRLLNVVEVVNQERVN